MLDIIKFMEQCESTAKTEVTGWRNQEEHAVKVAKRTVPARYTKQIKSATAVLRVVGKELGTKKRTDRRDVLECVVIDHITDKMVIGTWGERVPLDRVIAWGCVE